MDVLQQAQQKLVNICAKHNLDPTQTMTVRCLTPDEAIGAEASAEFDIKKGKERVIEADFDRATGSSVVNGSVNDLLKRFAAADKPLVFFCNTLAGVAALLDLPRLCPLGR